MSALLTFLDRPSSGPLTIAVATAIAGWVLHAAAYWLRRPARVDPTGQRRPPPLANGRIEPPAVVGLLTNDYEVPRSAVTATALDLVARGWIRFTTADDELVVITRSHGAVGDTLLPFEQQVLNHLAARAFNGVASASTLAASHHRLDRRWWMRYRRSVANTARDAGLSTRRYSAIELAPPALCALFGAVVLWMALRDGTDEAIADSWRSRLVWLLTLGALGLLVWKTVERALTSAQTPTDLGRERTGRWLGHRRRLRERIPEHASVLASPAQQVALAHGAVMGVSEQVLLELPATPEDHRRAWSEAGGRAHVVTVRYPIRPGYGQHPVRVGVAGVVVFLIARWLQGYFERVADGDALESLLERVPGQIDLIETIAAVLAGLCWLPVVWGAWAAVAGAIDSVATRERVGAVVRARRPVEVVPPLLASVVKPFAERDRFSTYLAVDDGKRPIVTSWLANERSAAPQGAQARVRATPLLGYVRSSEPIGTATRSDGD